jgi:hypothetical protein
MGNEKNKSLDHDKIIASDKNFLFLPKAYFVCFGVVFAWLKVPMV